MLRKDLFANPAGPPGTDGLTGELACYFSPVILRGPLQLHTLARALVSRDSFLLSWYALQPSIPDSGALRFLRKNCSCWYLPEVLGYGYGRGPCHLIYIPHTNYQKVAGKLRKREEVEAARCTCENFHPALLLLKYPIEVIITYSWPGNLVPYVHAVPFKHM